MFPFLQCTLTVEPMTRDDCDRLITSAELIIADCVGPKVMQLSNGNIIKLFRRKRHFSSAFFAPYAIRFANNAFQLNQLGIPTVKPIHVRHCREQHLHIVEYQPLAGDLLRGLLQNDPDGSLLKQTACFIASLHNKGVYFRSLHFENIIFDGQKFGLIDIADLKIYKRPLSQRLRLRNFQHFLRYPADKEIIDRHGLTNFEDTYRHC